ncbi:L,D-transpeptidase family protein [uncultured Microbacterium sp.]|uniref:L,D-transpeptidase family protein n=1 Tax=uncultured Microbacterium sp. TaxID=191216 RepID=UPI00261C248C|nr:L,D-transpeptidase family protein [uncultured Microbacterium sp.]
MTDLIDAPASSGSEAPVPNETLALNDEDRPVQWAPREPAPKKRRTGLWIGLGVAAVAVAAGVASVTLIAPGTTIAGIPVGGLTPAAAADVVASRVAGTEIMLTGAGGDQVVTGADLGASIDARALADHAFSAHPMWKIGDWSPEPIAGEISLDHTVANDALRGLLPTAFEDAVDATVVFDEASGTYVTTAAEAGTGIDIDALTTALASTVADGEASLSFSGEATEAPAAISNDEATAAAEQLNGMLASIGFYVGEERTVPISAAVAATWIDIVDDEGEITISADQDAIQAVVDTLPEKINRAAVDAEIVTNSAGENLRTLTEGATGRELGDVSGAAAAFAEQLETGNAVYALDVSETAFETTELFRRIDLNLSTQTVTLFENEKVVESWLVSTGLPATPTPTGNFTVFAYTSIQDMIGADYRTEDVKWNTWFAPDIAFHGAYWHNNFGHQMSHGCVNMPEWQAEYVYWWSAVGTEISVHW